MMPENIQQASDYSPRINRSTFLFCWFVLQLLLVVPGFIWVNYFDNRLVISSINSWPMYFAAGTALLSVIAYIYGVIVTTIYRLHDVGFSPWWSIAMFISPVNVILFVCLSLWSGSNIHNQYGEVPRGLQYKKVFRIKNSRPR